MDGLVVSRDGLVSFSSYIHMFRSLRVALVPGVYRVVDAFVVVSVECVVDVCGFQVNFGGFVEEDSGWVVV